MIDYFIKFYNNLSTIELVILWIIVFIFIILIGISINLYLKNKELKLLLKMKEKEKTIEKSNITTNNEETKAYSKNILKDLSTRNQTSPIDIVKQEENNIDFTMEITKKMEEELKPQTIELTDYEQMQEEKAIISYKELLNTNKEEESYNLDSEETDDFIKELKSFRRSL